AVVPEAHVGAEEEDTGLHDRARAHLDSGAAEDGRATSPVERGRGSDVVHEPVPPGGVDVAPAEPARVEPLADGDHQTGRRSRRALSTAGRGLGSLWSNGVPARRLSSMLSPGR